MSFEVLTMPRAYYVVVTDPEGATLEGRFVPITTRILFERGQAHGFENLRQKFTGEQAATFLSLIASIHSGTYNRFTWERE